MSSLAAFVVVSLATFVALGIGLAKREMVYEAAANISVVSTPRTEPIEKLSPREVRAAVSGLFESTPRDDQVQRLPNETADAVTDVAAEGGYQFVVGPSPNKNACQVVVRSDDSHRLAERLNDAARRFVEIRNAAAATAVASELATLRSRTAARREASDAAAQRLAELERQSKTAATGANEVAKRNAHSPSSQPPSAQSTAPATPQTSEPNRVQRTLNPAWVLLRDEVSLLEGKLAELRGRFTEQHPEVQHTLVALADRKAQFDAAQQYVDGGDAIVDADRGNSPNIVGPSIAEPNTAEPSDAPRLAPLNAPQGDGVVQTPPQVDRTDARTDARADVRANERTAAARAELTAANVALNDAIAAEDAAVRRQIELAANGPWRFAAADSIRTTAEGAAQMPWITIVSVALAAGLMASVLARGLAPIIDSPDDALAALGVKPIGVVRTDAPLQPRPFDPGVASARWLVRGGVAVIALSVAVAALAFAGNGIDLSELRRDPTVLLSLSRDWLASRLG